MATGPIAADLAPLGDNLLWVAHYDNAMQQVLVYDPSGSFSPDMLALPPGVSVDPDSPPVLAQLVSRRIYWVAVSQEQTAVLGGATRDLAPGVNTLIWP